MRILVIGAGVTGAYTAARLQDKGGDITIFARGEKAVWLAADGLSIKNGITGEERAIRIPVVQDVKDDYDLAMVFVQDIHRPGVLDLLRDLPGSPYVWFLGNTVNGLDRAGESLGKERVLGGFPDVGGTWEGRTLVIADRRKPEDAPFDELVIGPGFPEAEQARLDTQEAMNRISQPTVSYSPIRAWHLCHLALILPLAGIGYKHGTDMEKAAADLDGLADCMRALREAFGLIRRMGYPILPPRLSLMRIAPLRIGAARVSKTLGSPFGRIALGGHAGNVRLEMQHLAEEFIEACDVKPQSRLANILSYIQT